MIDSTVFQDGDHQAIHLPDEAALPAGVDRVEIRILGRARLILPASESWEQWFKSKQVSPDFMESRDQPADQERSEI